MSRPSCQSQRHLTISAFRRVSPNSGHRSGARRATQPRHGARIARAQPPPRSKGSTDRGNAATPGLARFSCSFYALDMASPPMPPPASNGQRSLPARSHELTGFCLGWTASPRCRRDRMFAVTELAESYGRQHTIAGVLHRMRCSGGCGGRAAAAWLVTGPVLNNRVRPRHPRRGHPPLELNQDLKRQTAPVPPVQPPNQMPSWQRAHSGDHERSIRPTACLPRPSNAAPC